MKPNVGGIDRALRFIVGVGLILVALFSPHPLAVWGWIGIIPLVTSAIRWCPIYVPFGISSCAKGQTREH